MQARARPKKNKKNSKLSSVPVFRSRRTQKQPSFKGQSTFLPAADEKFTAIGFSKWWCSVSSSKNPRWLQEEVYLDTS